MSPSISVTFEQPLAIQSASQGARLGLAAGVESPKTLTIFIVDDSELFQFYLKGFLKNHFAQKSLKAKKDLQSVPQSDQIKVYQFLNGTEAIQNLWRNPDVVLLDFYLDADVDGQNRNGDWVYEQIKIASPDSRVIMLSSATDPDIIVRMVKLGLRDYVLKDLDHLQDLGQYL